ncbi:MAG TPA: hypothetical protein PKV50_03335 [Prolixibacteraceae bacterium]|nr:hypothetical protein [Prolixibacteraceae bacterium]HUM88538.1 hypothetical protein [Prolixibacteraceae bacterium]
MESPRDHIESLIEKGEQYGKTTLKLIKLKSVDKGAGVLSELISWSIVIIFAVVFFTLANIALALWLGSLLQTMYLGFVIVAAFYGLLALLFLILRKPLLKKPMNNSLVKQFLD